MSKKSLKYGESSEIDSLFGKSVGGATWANGREAEYESGQITPPDWLAELISDTDFENVTAILGDRASAKANAQIRAIQRTAALDALREYFHGKALEILETNETRRAWEKMSDTEREATEMARAVTEYL